MPSEEPDVSPVEPELEPPDGSPAGVVDEGVVTGGVVTGGVDGGELAGGVPVAGPAGAEPEPPVADDVEVEGGVSPLGADVPVPDEASPVLGPGAGDVVPDLLLPGAGALGAGVFTDLSEPPVGPAVSGVGTGFDAAGWVGTGGVAALCAGALDVGLGALSAAAECVSLVEGAGVTPSRLLPVTDPARRDRCVADRPALCRVVGCVVATTGFGFAAEPGAFFGTAVRGADGASRSVWTPL